MEHLPKMAYIEYAQYPQTIGVDVLPLPEALQGEPNIAALKVVTHVPGLLGNGKKYFNVKAEYDKEIAICQESLDVIDKKMRREKDESEFDNLKKEKEKLLDKMSKLEYSKERALGNILVAGATNVMKAAKAAPKTPLFSLLLETTDSDTAKTLLLKGGSALTYGAAGIKIATQVYQNWGTIEDAKIREEKIQETRYAVETAYEFLKKAQSSFSEGSIEERLTKLKMKDYEKKLAYLDQESRKYGIYKDSASLSIIIVMGGAVFLSSGAATPAAIAIGLGTAANFLPYLALGGDYIDSTKKSGTYSI